MRVWAKEWEEKGSRENKAPFYKGLLAKLEDAEKGKKQIHVVHMSKYCRNR